MCDRLIAELRFLCRDRPACIDVVDIESESVLVDRYGERVPVVAVDGKEICEFRLDPARINRLLESG